MCITYVPDLPISEGSAHWDTCHITDKTTSEWACVQLPSTPAYSSQPVYKPRRVFFITLSLEVGGGHGLGNDGGYWRMLGYLYMLHAVWIWSGSMQNILLSRSLSQFLLFNDHKFLFSLLSYVKVSILFIFISPLYSMYLLGYCGTCRLTPLIRWLKDYHLYCRWASCYYIRTKPSFLKKTKFCLQTAALMILLKFPAASQFGDFRLPSSQQHEPNSQNKIFVYAYIYQSTDW